MSIKAVDKLHSFSTNIQWIDIKLIHNNLIKFQYVKLLHNFIDISNSFIISYFHPTYGSNYDKTYFVLSPVMLLHLWLIQQTSLWFWKYILPSIIAETLWIFYILFFMYHNFMQPIWILTISFKLHFDSPCREVVLPKRKLKLLLQ